MNEINTANGWRGSQRPDRLGGPHQPLPIQAGEVAEFRRPPINPLRVIVNLIAVCGVVGFVAMLWGMYK